MAQTTQNPVQQNLIARQLLLQNGLRMTKMLPVTTGGTLGSSLRVNLDRIGITTGVLLQVTVPVTITGDAATPSPFGPYTMAQLLKYTDYSGIQRIVTGGFHLHMLNSFRQRHPFALAASYPQGDIENAIDTNIFAVPTAAGNANIVFQLYVPMAVHPQADLRGAVLSQTIYGDHYITLDLPQNLVNSDALSGPYTAGNVALNGQIQVQAFQHYIMPQNGVNNLPMIDLSTIYSVEGQMSDSSNLSAGQAKYLNWPNNRAIMSGMHLYNNGGQGVLNGTDVTKIILLGNSNTNIREMNPAYLRAQMRQMIGTDAPSGLYFIETQSQPISTQLYGNVQTQFDINQAAANAYMSSQYESTYLSGTPLPGVVQ